MASVISTAMKAQLRLMRPLVSRLSLKNERMAQDAIGLLGAKALSAKVVYEEEKFDKFVAEWARCVDGGKGALLYLHGGAYVYGSIAYAKGFGGILCEQTQRDTLCVGYRLAPEFPFPAALNDAVEAYLRMLETYDAKDIAVAGESAGGGLTFALMQRIKEMKLPMPSAIVAISPWTDLTCSLPAHTVNEKDDPSLLRSSLRYSAKLYAKNELKNPLVSPAYADLEGLPPTLIFAGGSEILLDDSAAIAARLRSAGVDCTLHIEEEMWHCYVLFGIPEAKEALAKIKKFLSR